MASFLAYVGDNSVPYPAQEGQRKLLECCPSILARDERVAMCFRGRGGRGRDRFYFTNHRILVRDGKGVSGKEYQSFPFSKIKAYSICTAGSVDQDCELSLWVSGQVGRINFAFQKTHTDIFLILSYLNQKVLLRDPSTLFKPIEKHDSVDVHQSNAECWMSWLEEEEDEKGKEIRLRKIEAKLKERETPVLIPNEVVEMAFRCGRDTILLTNFRFLVIVVKGITGLRVKYFSLPWSHVVGFSVTMPSAVADSSSSSTSSSSSSTSSSSSSSSSSSTFSSSSSSILSDFEGGMMVLKTDIRNLNEIEQDLRREKVDLMALQKILSRKVLGLERPSSSFSHHQPSSSSLSLQKEEEEKEEEEKKSSEGKDEKDGGVLSWMGDVLGDNAKQLDVTEANEKFHSNPSLLQGEEFVEMCFLSARRECYVFTNKRLLILTLQGEFWWGKKRVEFLSFPWRTIVAFSLQSSDSFLDHETEICFWTNIMHPPASKLSNNISDPSPRFLPSPGKSFWKLEFGKDENTVLDLMAIQKYLSARCLRRNGGRNYLPSELPVSQFFLARGLSGGNERFFSWLSDDCLHQLGSRRLEEKLRSFGMLLVGESVRMAFGVGGGRDSVVFTNCRILHVDVHQRLLNPHSSIIGTSLNGNSRGSNGGSLKIGFVNLPYSSIRSFSIKSSPDSFDLDVDLTLRTSCTWNNLETIRFDFQEKLDANSLQSFLSAQIFGVFDPFSLQQSKGGVQGVDENVRGELNAEMIEGHFSRHHHQLQHLDPEIVDLKLHSSPPLLMPGERVLMAFKEGKEMDIFTTLRFLVVKGVTERRRKVEVKSLPWKFASTFTIQTSGKFDFESEDVLVYYDIPGNLRKKRALRKRGDLFAVQEVLVAMVCGLE